MSLDFPSAMLESGFSLVSAIKRDYIEVGSAVIYDIPSYYMRETRREGQAEAISLLL
jgi:hypothetical protein